jgi:Amidohydrolase family
VKTLLLVTYLTSLSASLLAQRMDTVIYSVVRTGTIVGEQKIWKTSDNEYNYTYYVQDRGRKKNLTERITTIPDGLITSVSVSGVDYNPYVETFELVKDSAISTLNGKRNSKQFNNELYRLATAPGVYELQLKWLLKQPGLQSATIPGGTIRIEKPKSFSISFNNKTETLRLFSIYTDADPNPVSVWMTNDMTFFGLVDIWTSVVPKGYEKFVDSLFSIQEGARQDIYQKQVLDLSSTLKKSILIKHVNLFESATATVKENMAVVVIDGTISDIFSSAKGKSIKADTIIDAHGKFLMPGLWDMHSHYSTEKGVLYLACGITHIRDMGNAQIIQTYQQQIKTNKLLGPDVSYLSGFIDKAGPMQGPTGKIVNSLSEALDAIEDFHKRKYNQIKIYHLIEPAWIKPLAAKAHSYGMRVCGHIPQFTNEINAINDGFDEITHMHGVFRGLIGGDTTLIIAPHIRERVGRLNLDDANVYRPILNLMKRKSIPLDATIALHENWLIEFMGDTSNSLKPMESWLPDQFKKDNFIISQPYGTDDKKEMYKASYQNSLKMLKLLYDNGITLLAGTDRPPYYLHRELELYVEAGIPANEVLKIATHNAANICGLQGQYGEIAIGKSADFILIAGNPTKNISDIRKVELVIKNGRQYNPKQLYASLGWKYYY